MIFVIYVLQVPMVNHHRSRNLNNPKHPREMDETYSIPVLLAFLFMVQHVQLTVDFGDSNSVIAVFDTNHVPATLQSLHVQVVFSEGPASLSS